MTNAFSKPLFLLEEDTDSTLIALLSGSLVYKIASSTRKAILEATKLLWMLKDQLQFLFPRGLFKIFPALIHTYPSQKNLEEHIAYTNSSYQFTDSRKDMVSKKIQHLANLGTFFFQPLIRNKALKLNEDEYFDVASTMLRHIVTAKFQATETLSIAPAKNFVFGSDATPQDFHYFEHSEEMENETKLTRTD